MAQQTGAIYHQGILYSGGSGTNVTPNPQGEATDTLNTVEIDGTVYDIEGGGSSNLIIDAQKYSLNEQVVGIWIDGKPLYQKTLYSATTVIGASTNFFDLSALYIDEMVDWHGNFLRDGKNYSVDMVEKPSSNSANTYARCRYVPDTKQFAVNVADFSGYPTSFGRLYVTIRYTKTTDTAGSGGYQAYGFSPIIYSDTEREVGVWRDNKPLYKKTFFLNRTVTDKAWTHYLLGTTGIDIKDVEGYFSLSSTDSIIPFYYYRSSNEYFTWYTESNNEDITVRPNMNAGASVIVKYVTIIYTKNSDVAGSGEYNTLAIPNVHYSTDEQVIGTWIDGKTLYQKTKIFPNTIAFSNDTVLDMEIVNVDTIFVEEGYFYDFYGNAIGKLPYSQDGNLAYTISVKVDISNKSHLKISSNTTFGVNSDRYIAVTVRYTKTTD